MALTIGARLGVYEVTALIGEGGMGQVYRATHTTLGRQVAIKILPDAFASDPERLARFEREAKTLASLNHPHIAAIDGFEKFANMHALVMELSRAKTWRSDCDAAPFPSLKRTALLSGSPRPTNTASFIVISSPRTSRSRPTAR